ncbi:MAG: class I SAM-dependent methyltransferase [Candidatus Omnitrophica bacterium]|nr:class I SAM-dependent methyltransferase [Candidatus Omnitrophota bacterium]
MEIDLNTYKVDYKASITYRGVLSFFKKQLAKSNVIADMGAGDASFINNLKIKYPKKEIIGIDIDPQEKSIIKADLSAIPYSENYFDALVCMDVVEHLGNDVLDKVLSEFYRVLKTGGQVLIATLLKEDILIQSYKCPFCEKEFRSSAHKQVFSEKELVCLLTGKGFNIKSVNITHLGIYSLLPFAVGLLKKLKIDKLLPGSIQKLLAKDIIIIAEK